jgi:hypothetical protein
MQIMSYLEQLRTEAATHEGNTEHTLRRAFAEAGLPSSTYYRSKYGAELKFATAKQVSDILHHWKMRELSTHESQPIAPDGTVTSA